MKHKPISNYFGRKAFAHIRQRFMLVAQQRLMVLQSALQERQRVLLDLLPLLLHINHPLLPGYVNGQVPAGLPDYSPSKSVLLLAKKFAKSFQHKRQAVRQFPIQALFLMGSGGSIAYSTKSDFDIWICYSEHLSEEECAALAQKCILIEQWAAQLGLEIHLYLINPTTFRQGNHQALSDESSGSAQHHLLLEEFYRTGLWVAGRAPMWWFVPPEYDAQYDEFVDDLLRKRLVDPFDVVDLGGLEQVDAKEFFSAAIWQLYKSIDAPYKSILKMMLMEVYTLEYPKPDWLSQRFKRHVYAGEIDNVNHTDPYLALCMKLDQFFLDCGDEPRLELFREAFYFKVALTKGTQDQHRREIIQDLVKQWGWDKTRLQILDMRSDWKIKQVKTERKRLSDEFSKSYRHLMQFAQNQGCEDLMASTDLKVLGRKLYAVLDLRAGKVDKINLGISANMVEPELTIQEKMGSKQVVWSVFTGDTVAVYSCRHLVELIMWCHWNGLVGLDTKFHLELLQNGVKVDEFHAILKALRKRFQQTKLPVMQDYMSASALNTAQLFVNVGVDPFYDLTQQGVHKISDRSDALCYGGVWENIGVSFDWVAVNTWHEVLVRHYEGITGLLRCICDYLNSSVNAVETLPSIHCDSFSNLRGTSIASRFKQLFDAIKAMLSHHPKQPRWYVLQAERKYYLIYKDHRAFQFQVLQDYTELVEWLSEPQVDFTPCIFDMYALENTVLKTLYSHNEPDSVQVFYLAKEEWVDVYVLDEKGCLFTQKLPFSGVQRLLAQLDRFLTAIQARKSVYSQSDDVSLAKIEYYEVEKSFSKVKIRKSTVKGSSTAAFFDVKVIATTEDYVVDYQVICYDRQFSSLEYGDALFDSVAEYIVECRTAGQRYPVYVTDIDVSPEILGSDQGCVSTVHYLKYKKKIESKLNRRTAIKKIQ
ncbi:MAG: class I adenylate cyclase [Methylococcales bacterium]|nr:class I adenylate cyclase [Methylococcales bacterium]MBT7443791.1 class I adenylate cyclase [Methylococcales bacterium]